MEHTLPVLRNIHKSFGQLHILRGLSLDAATGITCILGASGCGKSTLLRITAGLEQADTGDVLASPRHCATVFQDSRLLPWLTIRENLRLALPSSCPTAEKHMAETLRLVELPATLFNAMPRELSGGMAQRVGVARALLRSPDILLMDEPFASLDAITRAKLQSMLKRLTANIRCLFITHDMDEAFRIANRICVMDNGIIAFSCSSAEFAGPAQRESIRRAIMGHLHV